MLLRYALEDTHSPEISFCNIKDPFYIE